MDMSMTRKHFQSLAETTAEILNDLTSMSESLCQADLTHGQKERVIILLSDFCAKQNRNFDRERFAQAVASSLRGLANV